MAQSALIGGGLGGLGLLVAAWLAERGAKELILLGRSGRAAPSAAMTALQRAGPQPAGSSGVAGARQNRPAPNVTMVRCDVSDASEVAAAVERCRPALVVHASGVLQARLLRPSVSY